MVDRNIAYEYGRVQVSGKLLEESLSWRNLMNELGKETHEQVLDITIGPRFGPPVPRLPEPEPERCECCGQIIEDDEW